MKENASPEMSQTIEAPRIAAGLRLLLAAPFLTPLIVEPAFTADDRMSAGAAAAFWALSAGLAFLGVWYLIQGLRASARPRSDVLRGLRHLAVIPLLVFAADALVGEISPVPLGARLDVPGAEIYGWAMAPYQRISMVHPDTNEKTWEEINSRGWRDIEHDPDSDKPRIVLIGDSQVYGWGLEGHEILARRLEQALDGEYDILSFGVNGFGTDQQLLVLRNEALAWDPDYVIHLATPANDIIDNMHDRDPFGATPKPKFDLVNGELVQRPFIGLQPDPLRRFFSRSNICRLIRTQQLKGAAPQDRWVPVPVMGEERQELEEPTVFYEEDFDEDRSSLNVFAPPETWSENFRGGWDLTKALIRQMDQESEEAGADFILLLNALGPEIPPQIESRGRIIPLDEEVPVQLMQNFAAEEDIPILVTPDWMRERASKFQFANDPHLNEAGTIATAEFIADFIRKAEADEP